MPYTSCPGLLFNIPWLEETIIDKTKNNTILHCTLLAMNRIIIFLLLLLPFIADAQQSQDHVSVFTKDSFRVAYMQYSLENSWRFYEGDDPAMASVNYDDSKWDIVKPSLAITGNAKKGIGSKTDSGSKSGDYSAFSGIGWFRLHIITDSSLNGYPLALKMTHYGASEIFFDGVNIDSFGVIKGRDSTTYEDPQDLPFPLMVSKAGPHVIAVRYAYYNADKNRNTYGQTFRGFHMILGSGRFAYSSDRYRSIGNTFIFILLFGIFISLGTSHLFLWLYYRPLRSNLFFSIFCLSLALGFFVPFLNRVTHSPHVELLDRYVTLVLGLTGCYSLSGFTNELFSTKKLRFTLIIIFCLICPVVFVISPYVGLAAYSLLIATVLIETIILIIRAMYKRVKGARILGTGVLFFALLCFTLFLVGISGSDINDSTPLGSLFFALAACAILSIPVSLSLYLAWTFSRINKDLKDQLTQVQLLSAQALQQEQEKKRILESQNETLEREVTQRTGEVVAQKEKIEKQHDELKIEKKKSDDLLLNILPEEVAAELKEKGYSEARLFNDVTVLFTDFVDFTKAGDSMSAQELVNELHVCFKTFDEIISKHNIEKIKTIGDAYLAVCGLPLPVPGHAEKVVAAALEIVAFMAERKQQLGDKTFEVRVGVHSGSVVAGIVGVKKFAYDIWGDTVNTAARMEQNSTAGKINISRTTFDLVNYNFDCTYRGEINAKNKGELSMYFVDGMKSGNEG